MTRAILSEPRAGVLLHPTSLPGANGDLGPEAFQFADFLVDAGLTVWQMLPLGPTHEDRSPYHALSVHAGNTDLISLARLKEWGWIEHNDVNPAVRTSLLAHARAGFLHKASDRERQAHAGFLKQEGYWLGDYALYQALRAEQHAGAWWQWPAALRDRDSDALTQARTRLAEPIAQIEFEQFVFFRQWHQLREYVNARNIWLFGDMPIFVAHDSAEVWAHREYFTLDQHGQPLAVAGVPPDYFSEHGQRWGNPLYRWDRMKADGFKWWIQRMRTQLELFDLVRIDHFRGFQAYWEIPAGEATAVNGCWVEAPGEDLFNALHAQFDPLPIVAEDLGFITPQVHQLREQFNIPGMAVLQFAFEGGASNPYLPHRIRRDTAVYTGTHDNDTTLSWYEGLSSKAKDYVREYLGFPEEKMPWSLMRAAFASVAHLAVVPMQDVLGLGRGERMNTPGTTQGNWRWRFDWSQVAPETSARVHRMVDLYGRKPASVQRT